jgi:hypothetical protein
MLSDLFVVMTADSKIMLTLRCMLLISRVKLSQKEWIENDLLVGSIVKLQS